MLASSLLNEALYPLRKTDTVAAAKDFMAEQGVTELPILDNKELFNYARAAVLNDADGSRKLEEVIPYNPHAPKIFDNQHLYEIIPVFAASDLHVLAVVNERNEFLGIVDEKNIHKNISHSLTYKGVGAILVLQVEPKDFAPSHLARIVEENGAKILGLMLEQTEDSQLQVNIKLNTTAVMGIIASLNRFGYKVKEAFMAEDINKNDHREFDSVLKFFDL